MPFGKVERVGSIVVFAEVGAFGGTMTFAKQLVELANSRGQVIEIRFFVQTGSETLSLEWLEGLNNVTFQVLELPKGLAFRLAAGSLHLFLQLRTISASTSLILSVGTPGLFIVPLVIRKPAIYYLHSYPHGKSSILLGRFFGKFFPRTWHLVTVSEYALSRTRAIWRFSPNEFTSSVIRTGVGDIPDQGKERVGQANSSQPISVLCVAACELYKNPDVWLDVAESLERAFPGDFKFTWVGGGSELSRMRERVIDSGLQHSVDFVGWKKNVQTYYPNFDIYFQTSSVEALGLSLIEAARAGLPSVVTEIGGMPEVVQHGLSGFVCNAENTLLLRQALVELGRDRNLRQLMGAKAREIYERRFRLEKWEEEITATCWPNP